MSHVLKSIINVIHVCLFIDRGKDLLKRIVKAGLDQNNPVQEWRSKLSKLLRAKRNTLGTESIISKAKTIYAGK